ncbi:longitudinals lacking protein, isoforms H/M/V-like isoform X5 [Amphibalanus amphitrite]|nr:longitudinals lacking protein, isoforms H/M/V-like isoform X5 [Amphibalanus amphitrite]
MDSQKFCLKWDGFQGSVTSVFDQLRSGGELLDVTLCCEGQRVRAHRMMLSACSPYFRELLKSISCQQMVIFLKDTTAADLNAIVEFMYKGSVNVSQSQLASFIKTAEMLQIRGLSGEEDKPPDPVPAPPPRPAPPRHHPLPPRLATPPPKRRRTSDSGDAPLSSGPAPAWPRPAASPARRPETPVVLSGSSNQSIPSPSPAVAMSPAASATATAASAPAPGSAEAGGGAEGAPSLPASSSTTPSVAPSGSTFTSSSAAPSSSFSPSAAGSSVPTARSRETVAKHESENIKVEKVDLSDGEDGGSLDAALGQLNEYEGYDGTATSAHGVSFAGGHQYGPLPTGLPGASHQSPHGAPMEDGSAPGAYVCVVCGKRYRHQMSLTLHRKVHEGLTICPLCGTVSSKVSHLRRHLENVHRLEQEQIYRLVPSVRARSLPQAPAGVDTGHGDGEIAGAQSRV